ncbi:MAG: hypothetical protein HUK07_02845, partial [Bacteroidaceae bacterium]|nr:hypothetical protein [Bacteroidaceae bacterium]
KTAMVVNGKIRTAYGMEYAVLVVPQARPMNPNNINIAKEDIERLRAQGATIIETPWTECTLNSLNIRPDIVLPDGLDYCHRTSPHRDVYFISNQTDKTISFCIKDLQLRSDKSKAFLFDPISNKYFRISEAQYSEPLSLATSDSRFIILSNEDMAEALDFSKKKSTTIADLSHNAWQISFEETGKQLQTNELKDWALYEDPAIKYYSGHAVYATEFDFNAKKSGQEEFFLVLEQVDNIASVKVNGIECGTVWRAPYEVDITKALQKSRNKIEISVVNTWANALLGNDQGTPPFSGIWTNGKYRRAEKTLLPAGLKGKVAIIQQ